VALTAEVGYIHLSDPAQTRWSAGPQESHRQHPKSPRVTSLLPGRQTGQATGDRLDR